MHALLEWLSAHIDMTSIHLTNTEPGTCHIGRVLRVSDDAVALREIGLDARWKPEELELWIDEIERVDFGGAYEEALLIGATVQRTDS